MAREIYSIKGVAVTVERFTGEMDVSAIVPPYPGGTIPDGETEVLVYPLQGDTTDGWWLPEETFADMADPVSRGALEADGVEVGENDE